MPKKNIVIYGATGSIGDSTLNLVRNNIKDFNIVGLTCNSSIEKLAILAKEFDCRNVGIANKKMIANASHSFPNVNIYAGLNEFFNIVSDNNIDIIIYGISGSSSLNLLLQLAETGKILGMANKECIICAGNLFMNRVNEYNTQLIPLDSEHNAIYSLIKNKNKKLIRNYTITASGGNFYNYDYDELRKITPKLAINHPKWKMGEKISVDSSTLMNKGLEIIEACILFNISHKDIDAIIHPESIIHALINFYDFSSHAFLSQPNMEVSISSVLFKDKFISLDNYTLDLREISSLNFFHINNRKFKAIEIAKLSIELGGLIPSILNYTNELMVKTFLEGDALFTDIVENNEIIMNKFITDGNNVNNPTIDDINQSFMIIDDYFLSNDILRINK